MSFEKGTAELFIAAAHPLAESIMWDARRQQLLWVDLLEPALHAHDFASGKTTRRPLPLPPPIGSFVLTDHPDVVVLSHRSGLSYLHIPSLALTPFCDPEQGRDGIIYNDMKTDPFGRLWVGTSHAKEKDPRGALWCVTPEGAATLVDVGFPVSNGPAFSRDGRTMYFNDSAGRQTLAYDLHSENPVVSNRRVFATYGEAEGMPDGLVVDAEDCIWTAQWGGACIIRLSPAGEKIGSIAVPSTNVTTLCFAGAGLTTLYVTTARDGLGAENLGGLPLSGSVFTFASRHRGLSEPLFKPR